MVDMVMLYNASRIVCALVSLGVGLDAAGIDVLKALNLGGLRIFMQYLALASGALLLASWFMNLSC